MHLGRLQTTDALLEACLGIEGDSVVMDLKGVCNKKAAELTVFVVMDEDSVLMSGLKDRVDPITSVT